MFKRMMALLLCLVMVCSLLPVGAFAEEDVPEIVVPEEEVETFDAPAPAPEEHAAVTGIEIPFRVNPLYAGQISVAEPAQEGESAALFAAPVYGTVAEAKATLREGMKARLPQVLVYVKTTYQDFSTMWDEIFYGAMEHNGDSAAGDYLKYQYAGYGGAIDGEYDSAGNYYMIFTYDLAYCDTQEQQDIMDSAVATLLGQLNLYGKSDYEKICGIYDWMCANITYDYDNLEDDSYLLMYTAYAALVNRTAVCQGYANLFYRLALELGVDSRIISGTGISNTGSGPHAWNIVKLSGSYYDVDATWDATWKQAGLEYDWFLKNEADFSQDHIRAYEFTTAAFHAAYPMGTKDYSPYIAQGTCGDNLTWKLSNEGVLTISGTGAMDNYESTLPRRVSVYAPWSEYRDSVNTVIIENGVTTIGDWTFANCTNLTEVEIPSSITDIGDGAFYDCTGLTGVEIPDSVTAIGDYAFRDCTGLTAMEIPDSVTAIGDEAFSDCTGLTAMELSDSLTAIGDRAFYYCTGLAAMEIPDSVTNIGEWAFYGCAGLTGVELSDSLTGIGGYAFSDCTGLTSVKIPGSVTAIANGAFSGCTSLAEIIFEGDAPGFDTSTFIGVTATAYYHYSNETWTSDVMQDYGGTITWVALESYTCGDNLTWTLTEDGVLNIRGTGDMYDYPGDVDTPWSEYWDIIETVNIENGVTSIGDFAFWGNSAMTEVNIPDSVTRIGVGAFSDCGSLTGVEIPDSVTGIGTYAFSPCISLTEILVDEDNPNYSSDAYGVLFNKDKTALICCPAGKTGEYKIPDSVTVIGDYAFESCEGLTSVEIGSSVTDIGTWGFGYCINLAEITFKGSAPAFSDDAFKMVTDATAYYPAGNDTWTEAVMQDYGGTINWVAYADGMAKIGDVAYATVADALEAAEVGDTVTLLQNAEEDTVTVRKGITLDLNSYALTADYVFAVNGSNIVDNSSDNTGVLVVNPDHMMINSGNSDLPIWNGEGFIFIDILNFQEMYTTNDAGQKQYIFLPSFETIAHQYLVQGMENSRVKIAIRMTWEIETGSAFQNFVFNDKTVKKVIDSYAGGYYGQAFYATITNSEYADFDLKVVLISDTGVELMLN